MKEIKPIPDDVWWVMRSVLWVLEGEGYGMDADIVSVWLNDTYNTNFDEGKDARNPDYDDVREDHIIWLTKWFDRREARGKDW